MITDRYLDSSVAYQGSGRDLDFDEVRNISLFAVGGLLPDLTVLLDLEASKAMARRNKTGAEPDRLEREKAEFFETVRQSFLGLAAAEPNRFLVVDAELGAEEIQNLIRARVETLLG